MSVLTQNQKLYAEIKAKFDASKGGNTPGITEDDRYEMAKQMHALTPPQPFFCAGSPAMVQLETMVDRAGMRNVLYALASICDAKGEHLRTNWQDANEARLWERDGDKLSQLTTQIAASGARRVRGAP